MGTMWPRSSSFEFDASGAIANGAKAYFFEPGTTTPKPVYEEAGESTAHDHPVLADSGRWPAVFIPFGSGSYKLIITTSGGTTLFSADDIPNPEPFSEDFELDETTILQTGHVIPWLDNAGLTGFVRLNGRSIGNAASSATERANADCEDLFTFLWDKLANAQAAVSGGRGASASADFAANKRITLPDWRAVGPLGFDDMGNSAASLLGSAPVVTGGATTTGSILGANTHTLTTSESAAHTHSFSATTGSDGAHTHTAASNGDHSHTISITDPGHTHSPESGSANFIDNKVGGGVQLPGAGTGAELDLVTASSTTGITASSNSTGAHTHSTDSQGAHTHTVSGTSGSTGSGGAHNNLQRSGLVTWLVKL